MFSGSSAWNYYESLTYHIAVRPNRDRCKLCSGLLSVEVSRAYNFQHPANVRCLGSGKFSHRDVCPIDRVAFDNMTMGTQHPMRFGPIAAYVSCRVICRVAEEALRHLLNIHQREQPHEQVEAEHVASDEEW